MNLVTMAMGQSDRVALMDFVLGVIRPKELSADMPLDILADWYADRGDVTLDGILRDLHRLS